MLGSTIFTKVFGTEGFSVDLVLPEHELAFLRAAVERQWLEVIAQFHPALVGKFQELGIGRYHEKAHLLNHESFWTKSVRLLPSEDVQQICGMTFLHILENAFGKVKISDDELKGWPTINWRIVRPFAPHDYGPLHADAWFWDLGNGIMPHGMMRIKVWVPLHCEPGYNGLRVIPGSHFSDYRYYEEFRHGYAKPQIDEDEDALQPELLPTLPGQLVIFHDLLLHGGSLNKGGHTRVSAEFTLLVSEARLKERYSQAFGAYSPRLFRPSAGPQRRRAA